MFDVGTVPDTDLAEHTNYYLLLCGRLENENHHVWLHGCSTVAVLLLQIMRCRDALVVCLPPRRCRGLFRDGRQSSPRGRRASLRRPGAEEEAQITTNQPKNIERRHLKAFAILFEYPAPVSVAMRAVCKQ